MAISAKLVKELREKTGAGMMDCKKALTETDGDIDKAIDYLREKGIAKAAKKADRIAAEGLVHVEVKDNEAAIVEINSETDFVARNEGFQELVKEIANHILDSKVETVDALMESKLSSGKTVDERMKEAISTIGEKLSIRRFSIRTKTCGPESGSPTRAILPDARFAIHTDSGSCWNGRRSVNSAPARSTPTVRQCRRFPCATVPARYPSRPVC